MYLKLGIVLSCWGWCFSILCINEYELGFVRYWFLGTVGWKIVSVLKRMLTIMVFTSVCVCVCVWLTVYLPYLLILLLTPKQTPKLHKTLERKCRTEKDWTEILNLLKYYYFSAGQVYHFSSFSILLYFWNLLLLWCLICEEDTFINGPIKEIWSRHLFAIKGKVASCFRKWMLLTRTLIWCSSLCLFVCLFICLSISSISHVGLL